MDQGDTTKPGVKLPLLLLIPLLSRYSLVDYGDGTLLGTDMAEKQGTKQEPLSPRDPVPDIPLEQILEQETLPLFQVFRFLECCFQECIDVIHRLFLTHLHIDIVHTITGASQREGLALEPYFLGDSLNTGTCHTILTCKTRPSTPNHQTFPIQTTFPQALHAPCLLPCGQS